MLFLTWAGFCCRSKAGNALQKKKSIDLYSLFLSRKLKAHARISSCLFLTTAYLDLGFLNILFSVFQQTGVLYCVYPHLVLKHVTHLMFVLTCISKKSIILLLSQDYLHWASAVSERKIYACLLSHFILVSFLSEGLFLWCIFGLGSFLRNHVTFGVVLYDPEIGQEPPEVFVSVNKLPCIQPNQYNLIL